MTEALSRSTMPTVAHILRPDRGVFSIERVSRDLRAGLPADITARAWVCPYPSRGLLPRLRGARAARRVRGRVLHMTGDAHYLALFLPRARTVLTVHDCDAIHRARGLKRLILWLVWFRLPLARAAAVVVPSEATRRDLLKLVRIDPAKVVMIENPVSPSFGPSPLRSHGGPLHILQIGTKANKNIPRLAAALSGLEVRLFIVGRPSADQTAALAAARIKFHWAENLSEEALHEAYRACDIVAFCSLSEGFGLPLVEAQRVGRPIVTSNRAPMTDVAGQGAEYADPENIDDMRRAFVRLIESPARRAELVALGRENVRRYSAERAAEAHARLYRRVARGAPLAETEA